MTWSILIVEDNNLIRQVLCTLIDVSDNLTLTGAAESGDEALRIIGDDVHVDAVICDIQMPGMTGLELIPQLLLIQPKLVVVTYSSEEVDPATAHRLGITHTFDKAGDPIKLLELVADLCAQARPNRFPQEDPTRPPS